MAGNVTPVGISIPNDLLEQIDTERGDVPRSRFVLRKLQLVYETSKGSRKK